MKCSKTKLVSPYIDGELDEENKASFEAHAHGCPACSARLAAYRDVKNLFAGSVRHAAPYGFSTRVTALVAEQEPGRGTAFPLLVRLAQAVIILLVMTVGVLSGGFLAGGVQGQRMANVASSLSLDVFEPAPPDSLGGVYLAMTETNHEK